MTRVWSEAWTRWVEGSDASAVGAVMRIILRIASIFYGAAVRIRNRAYDAKIFTAHRVPVPVISIGNLSLGGTGKSPLTVWCARTLLAMGKKPVILSRGYGRNSSGSEALTATHGGAVSGDASRFGDEPVMLARALRFVPVIVGSDRVRSARLAMETFNPDVLLLDDGFQHRRLHRDLDVLCFNESMFRAPDLFPSGVLREPWSGISRARCAAMKSQNGKISRPLGIPTATYRYRIREVEHFASGDILGADWLKGRKIIAASAIAHPEDFESMLAESGAQMAGRERFPDHFAYGAADLDALRRKARECSALLAMTEKDAVKLPPGYDAFIVKVGIEWIENEDVLKRMLSEAVKR